MILMRNPLVWLSRVRNRKGYGVHSPFAFQLITGVIYEQTPYYAYTSLARLHSWPVRFLGLYTLQCHRALFRLANYQHPSSIIITAATHHEEDYFRAAVPSAKVISQHSPCSEKELDSLLAGARAPLLFLANAAISSAHALAKSLPESAMLIVEGIHRNATSLSLWHELQADQHTGITFDLYTYGICFFNSKMHKQHYVVNF